MHVESAQKGLDMSGEIRSHGGRQGEAAGDGLERRGLPCRVEGSSAEDRTQKSITGDEGARPTFRGPARRNSGRARACFALGLKQNHPHESQKLSCSREGPRTC